MRPSGRRLALIGLAVVCIPFLGLEAFASGRVPQSKKACHPRVVVRGPARFYSDVRLLPAGANERVASTEGSGEAEFPGLPRGVYDAHVVGITEFRPDTGGKLKDSLGVALGDSRWQGIVRRWLVRYGDCRDSLVVVLSGGEWERIETTRWVNHERILGGAGSSSAGQAPDSVRNR